MHSQRKWKSIAQARVLICIFAAPLLAGAQTPSATQAPPEGRTRAANRERPAWPPEGPAPLNAEGKPDISGAWEPNAIRQNVNLASTGVEIPFQLGSYKLFTDRIASLSKDDPEGHCLPPGVPRMSTTPYPFRIMQTPAMTLIVYEGGAHIWRQIFTDGRPHTDDPNPSWLGESIGHWEGDDFVVDTIGLNGRSWIDESGLPTSDALHVIERFHRIDLGHMSIEHTIDDPKTYTAPWKFTTHPTMLRGELMEYICQENNRDVDHLVGK